MNHSMNHPASHATNHSKDLPSSEESRRFTDQEVALVLKKAAEIDEAQAREGGRSLSLQDLQEIAGEVGISPESLATALSSLERGHGSEPTWSPAPRVRRAVHAVRGELGREAMARLIGLIDERTDGAGTVAEALGTIRWTGRDRFKSTQVSLTPQDGETVIQVVEKAEPHLVTVFQVVPGAWGGIIGLSLAAPLGLGGVAVVAAVVSGVGVGLAAGRLAWARVSERSRARVEGLAAELAETARNTAVASPGREAIRKAR